MSHHNYSNHGRPFRPSPAGGDSHGGSSYSRQGRPIVPSLTIALTENSQPLTPQMDLPDHHQTNDFPAEAPPPDPFSHSIPHRLYNHTLQNAWVPLAPAYGQLEGHREDIPPPVGGVAGPGRVQDPHRIDMAYQGIVDYRPQPLANPAYIFPDVEHAQGIQGQVQPNALVNQGCGVYGHVPQHMVPDPPQAAFPHLFVHGIPTPNQPRPEDLRRLASHYWYHPNVQVGSVSVETGTTGQYRVMITLEAPIGF